MAELVVEGFFKVSSFLKKIIDQKNLSLASNDIEVHRTTSQALFQLSKDPWNCVTMHQHGVVGHLLRLIGKYFLSTIYF